MGVGKVTDLIHSDYNREITTKYEKSDVREIKKVSDESNITTLYLEMRSCIAVTHTTPQSTHTVSMTKLQSRKP